MNDVPDPSEAAEAALATAKGDNGQVGTARQFQGKPLNPFSLHHYEAYGRLTFDGISVRESAALCVFLCHKTGREASALRTEKQLADFRFDAGEWAMTIGAPNPVVVKELCELKDAILSDIEQAESIKPDTKGGAPGNA